MWFDPVVLVFYLSLHSSGMNIFKSRRMTGNRTAGIYSDFEFRFEEDLIWLDLEFV